MSGELNIPQLAPSQSSPEVTVNNATAAIEAAIVGSFTADCTSGSVVVSSAQYRAALRFFITNVTTARNVTLPAIKRTVFIAVDSGNSGVASLVVGSTSVALVAGNNYLAFTDGTTNGLTVYALGSGNTIPYDLSAFIPGTLSNSQLCLRMKAIRPFTLPASLTGSFASAGTASTGTVSFTIKKAGSSIGTVTFTASATGTFTFAAAVTFAAGDLLEIIGPATADATLADVALNFKGSR